LKPFLCEETFLLKRFPSKKRLKISKLLYHPPPMCSLERSSSGKPQRSASCLIRAPREIWEGHFSRHLPPLRCLTCKAGWLGLVESATCTMLDLQGKAARVGLVFWLSLSKNTVGDERVPPVNPLLWVFLPKTQSEMKGSLLLNLCCGFFYHKNSRRWKGPSAARFCTTNTVGNGRAPPVHPLLRDLYL